MMLFLGSEDWKPAEAGSPWFLHWDCPGGAVEISPVIYRWVAFQSEPKIAPEGQLKLAQRFIAG